MELFSDLINWIVGTLTLVVAWILKTVTQHTKSIAKLEVSTVPSEQIRAIVESETGRLHEEHKEFRNEVRDDMGRLMDKLEQLRRDLGKSRATD